MALSRTFFSRCRTGWAPPVWRSRAHGVVGLAGEKPLRGERCDLELETFDVLRRSRQVKIRSNLAARVSTRVIDGRHRAEHCEGRLGSSRSRDGASPTESHPR